MKKSLWMLITILLFCSHIGVYGQIPDEVKDMWIACKKKMNNPAGTQLNMNIHMSMLIIKTDMQVVVSGKGGKSLMKGSMKIMGREFAMEHGFDGQQEWKYKHLKLKEGDEGKGKERKDTLFITKTNKKSAGNADIDFDLIEDYQKAMVKQEGRYHVITLSKPKSKDDPKKITIKIDKEKSLLREMSYKESGARITMTITHITFGVNDNIFMLDTSKYPGAIIVRK